MSYNRRACTAPAPRIKTGRALTYVRIIWQAPLHRTAYLLPEEVEFPLELVDALDVRHVSPLEGGEVRVEIRELDHAQLPEVGDARVRRVLIDDDGHVRHVF